MAQPMGCFIPIEQPKGKLLHGMDHGTVQGSMVCTMHGIFHGIYVTLGQVHGARRCQRGHFVPWLTHKKNAPQPYAMATHVTPNPMPWPRMSRVTEKAVVFPMVGPMVHVP